MNLQYIVRNRQDEDGYPYEQHCLVDGTSERYYGAIDAPTAKQMFYSVFPEDSRARGYLSLEAAKGYLEEMALEEDMREARELGEKVQAPTTTPKRKTKVKK